LTALRPMGTLPDDASPGMPLIYLDVCCLNRPFDDQRQPRVHLETEAVRSIIQAAVAGDVRWLGSDVVEFEILRNPDAERRQLVAALAALAIDRVVLQPADRERGRSLAALGFGAFDALHLACAERGRAEVLLTTDDRLLRRATRHADELRVRVLNPVTWVTEAWAR
jgi:predicted nucleic acid-binding protein